MKKACASSLDGEQIQALIAHGQEHFRLLNSYGVYSTGACHECVAFNDER